MSGSADSDFTRLLDTVFGHDLDELTELAEQSESFPRKIIELIGAAGVFEQKWADGPQPDLAKLLALADRLGRLGSAGVGVGVSLHDSAIAVLRRFARNQYLRDIADSAIRGETVLCIGASEESGGSDLQNVQTEVRACQGGFTVTGRKKFVSLAPIADHILVVARGVDAEKRLTHGNVALLAIPTTDVIVHKPYRKAAAGPLSTAAVDIDTWVPQHCLVARAGTGLAAVSWGLAHERLSIAGQVAGACARIIGITLARMMSRSQFGKTLYEHQALRLRMADLQSRVDMLHLALTGVATQPQMNLRTAAALKVSAARLGEEVLSECMHIFGGAAFLIDETPIGRWWQDMKLARIGGGTDEVLWELVAATMTPDHTGYRTLITKEH